MAALALGCAMPLGTAQAQTGTVAQALQDYQETLRQADSQMAAGNAFEAIRLYERAGRIAYNSKLAVDSSALNQKLAAARSARDTRSSLPSATTAAPPNLAAPADTSSPAAAAGAGVAQFDEIIRYGDSLAAVGEYVDAVRAYERARRMAVNGKLAYDRAALDSKITSASQASKQPPRIATELIPPPPPPMPHEPGTEPGLRFLPQQPGKLRPWSLEKTFVMGENRITETEFRELDANLRRIESVIGQAPALNPVLGFELYIHGSLGEIEAVEERKRHLAQGLPLPANIVFSAPAYYETRLRSKSTGVITTRIDTMTDVSCALRIYVNRIPVIGAELSDAEGGFFLEPNKTGELGGFSVYDDVLVITRPGDTLWTAVSTERVLKFLMPDYQHAAEQAVAYVKSKQRAYDEFMSAESQDRRRREAQALRTAGGASAEDNARRLEVKQRRWEEDARKEAETVAKDPKWRAPGEAYEAARSMLSTLDAKARAGPACVMRDSTHSDKSGWKLVPMGTPGCRPVVRTNPSLLNNKLPRSALQVMYARNITECNRFLESSKQLRNNPGDCVAMAHLLRQVDWQRLAGLLTR